MIGKTENLDLNISKKTKTGFLTYRPRHITDKIPLIISLHGSGEIATAGKVETRGIPGFIKKGNHLNAVVVAPILQRGDVWCPTRIFDFIENILRNSREIDETKIHLTGYSLGALACWPLLFQNPRFFQTVSVICGSGDPCAMTLLKESKTKIWIFHGKADERVGVVNALDMIDALERMNYPFFKSTIYDRLGHAIFDRVYETPDLYKWMSVSVKLKPNSD